jgi:hypothetical protein
MKIYINLNFSKLFFSLINIKLKIELERNKNIDSEWQSGIFAEISKTSTNLTNQQLETIQKVIKYQLFYLQNFKKLFSVSRISQKKFSHCF